MKHLINIIAITFGFVFLSCNPKMEVPSYLYIENVDVITTYEQEGTASFKTPDIWVTVNGTGIGAYQLPALVPVLANENTEIFLEAGIKLNGRTEWRPKYPLFTLHKETVHLEKGKIDTISAVFRYLDYVKFALMENFESAGLKFHSVNGGAELKKTQDTSLLFHYRNEPNNFSGIIELPAADSIYFFEIQTTSPLQLNAKSADMCFVELNFCFDYNVEIGIYCHFPASSSMKTLQIPIANIIGRENNTEWNKIYINLTDEMADVKVSSMTHFDIYMKCGIPKNKKAKFLFDNIKVVHI